MDISAKAWCDLDFYLPPHILPFQAKLNTNPARARNNGTGALTVPSEKIGYKLLDHLRDNQSRSMRKSSNSSEMDSLPKEWFSGWRRLHMLLPTLKDVKKTLHGLNAKAPANSVHFIEWEGDYVTHSTGRLNFDYDHKPIRITDLFM
ncbi:hypothetical protein BYT27DRAFT_7262741 [Phlegmacium glaucopus]|nr:hypothetical protein BYT27DRAFT_7262741 [Phlegmacium glaucopus]